MTDKETLLTGWINFALLAGMLTLVLRPLLHHYFFERRNKIKEFIAKSVEALEHARARARKAHELDATLDEDIEKRRSAIEATCSKECESIIEEARNKQRHILDNAAKGSGVERKRAIELVRIHMLDSAFERAKKIFVDGASKDKSKAIVGRALEELVEKRPFTKSSPEEGKLQ